MLECTYVSVIPDGMLPYGTVAVSAHVADSQRHEISRVAVAYIHTYMYICVYVYVCLLCVNVSLLNVSVIFTQCTFGTTYTLGQYYDDLYYIAEFVHICGMGLLMLKLKKQKNCAGVSLKMQELTAIFLMVRMFCEATSYRDLQQAIKDGLIFTWMHFTLDAILLTQTCIVIHWMRNSLRATYMADLDPLKKRYLIVPCFCLAVLVHPPMEKAELSGVSYNSYWYVVAWSFGVYCETVSVLPQFRMLQYSKVVESYTAHYIFSLALARFLVVVHWTTQLCEEGSYLWKDVLGPILWRLDLGPRFRHNAEAMDGGKWALAVFLSEILQSFLYVDFCFYYVANMSSGGGSLRLPSGMTV